MRTILSYLKNCSLSGGVLKVPGLPGSSKIDFYNEFIGALLDYKIPFYKPVGFLITDFQTRHPLTYTKMNAHISDLDFLNRCDDFIMNAGGGEDKHVNVDGLSYVSSPPNYMGPVYSDKNLVFFSYDFRAEPKSCRMLLNNLEVLPDMSDSSIRAEKRFMLYFKEGTGIFEFEDSDSLFSKVSIAGSITPLRAVYDLSKYFIVTLGDDCFNIHYLVDLDEKMLEGIFRNYGKVLEEM